MPVHSEDTFVPAEKLPGFGDVWQRSQLNVVLEAHQRLLRQIEDVNSIWATSIKRVKESEEEYVRCVAQCRDPAKLATIYMEWMTSSAASSLIDAQKLGLLWVKLYSDGLNSARNISELS